VLHREGAHLVVGILGEQLALDDVRVLEDLRGVVDRADGDLGLLEESHVLGLGAPGDECADDRVELGGVLDAPALVAVARIVNEVGATDRAEGALGHFLRRRRKRDKACRPCSGRRCAAPYWSSGCRCGASPCR
jgi:hypothetical protein